MKKVVNGLLFDTSQSTHIAKYKDTIKHKNMVGTFDLTTEYDLYKTKNDRWFEVAQRFNKLNVLNDDQVKKLLVDNPCIYMEHFTIEEG
ncbi:hypothetical protein JOC34_000591 [Virgibacillus halotolerans]|uniref:hypothetical protein n=1 Tax=Virgibacillus halotolerans TaxID=1071053 RepID=UPI001961D908|nr:hypothetical protein [Virgibacillus halotolerans]MBM7598234.1 hypothetical protein [Virgibacillus halotolerans]